MKIKRLISYVVLTSLIPAMNAEVVDNLSTALDEVARVKKAFAPDARQNVYDVKAYEGSNKSIILDGFVSEQWLADTLVTALKNKQIAIDNSIVVYPSDQWAMSRISVSCLRSRPAHAAEMSTQALMGMPMRILEKQDDWLRVQTPDGYIGWVTDASVVFMNEDEMSAWRKSKRMVVSTPYQTRVYVSPKASGVREVVTDLVLSNIVVATDNKAQNGRTEVVLPDGRTGWVETSALTPIEKWASQEFNAETILDVAYSMEGTPYLWGGCSVKTLDCSGLVKTSYLANGLILMRDASQQALTGTRIEAKDWPTCQAGDLLFFGNAQTGRVTHVAIYDHDGNYVHSSGRVKRNSVDPKSELYLTTPFLHSVRINGNQGSKGITRAIDHPWYFER